MVAAVQTIIGAEFTRVKFVDKALVGRVCMYVECHFMVAFMDCFTVNGHQRLCWGTLRVHESL